MQVAADTDLDAAWIGSWEESFGEARQAEAAEEEIAPPRDTLFLAGMDTREQSEAITAAAHHFLADEECTRLAVVFPAPGALSTWRNNGWGSLPIVIDQTNPTPRVRKAQALIALGRGKDGDAILKDIVGRKWHDKWEGVMYQAHDLLDRGGVQ